MRCMEHFVHTEKRRKALKMSSEKPERKKSL
jgi:hypothetical protein